jgi:hypothetical protein
MSGISYAEFEARDRRLVLLRALEAAAQYRANAFLLHRYCQSLGHAVSVDRLEQDLAWLAEQGLVTLQSPDGVTVVTATARGLDVAAGRATVPGVARPAP